MTPVPLWYTIFGRKCEKEKKFSSVKQDIRLTSFVIF